MIVADVLMWFLLVMGTYAVFISYWLATQALFPNLADDCRLRLKTAPLRHALTGLAWTVPLVIAGIALLNVPNPAIKFAGATILLLLILAGLVGSAGLAAQIGHGLSNPADEVQPWRRVLRGGAVLWLTFVFPLIGWFLILPLSLIMGIGALFGTMWRPRMVHAPGPPVEQR